MVYNKRKSLTIIALTLVSVFGFALAINLYQIILIEKANLRINNGNPILDSSFYEEKFAVAEKYFKEEKYERALAVYNNIELSNAASYFKEQSLFNSANIYFSVALMAKEDGDSASATPNFELAKSTYRKCLNINPYHEGARYNLERALLFSPEKNFNPNEDSLQPERGESAVTTMKLQAQGMP